MNRPLKHLGLVGRRAAIAIMAIGSMIALTAVPARAGTEVPFHLEQVLQVVSNEPHPDCGPLLTVRLEGEGVATHLGRFTEEEIDCINPFTLTFDTVMATLTAADGSQLFADAEGQLFPTGVPGLFDFQGTVTFVGGTGRFEGASGSAEGNGTFNSLTGQATNTVDGTLVLPVG